MNILCCVAVVIVVCVAVGIGVAVCVDVAVGVVAFFDVACCCILAVVFISSLSLFQSYHYNTIGTSNFQYF